MKKIHSIQQTRRSGTATVEAAVCLPLLLLLVLGAIESSNAIFLKQSLSMAAYEAAKIATRPNGTRADAKQRCREVLTVRDVRNFDLKIGPGAIDKWTRRGTRIGVTVTVDADAAALGPLWFFEGKKVSSTVYMVRL